MNVNKALLYTDTLGLMCTNKTWSSDSIQKRISWLYLTKSGNGTYKLNSAKDNYRSKTGMLSSNAELFLHPPRIQQYTILEICPFPYLYFPLSIGKKWNWDLKVGDQYCPNNTIKWTGDELFKSAYQVADTVTIDLPAGKIFCYQIHAVNTSKFGTSTADFYYSYHYGIVRLSYLPFDQTKIEINFLTQFNDPELFNVIFPRYKNDAVSWDYFLK